jgi:hypothetical protein
MRGTRFSVTLLLNFTTPSESTHPHPLSPKVMYSFGTTEVKLENHLQSLIMCLEQPESINQKLSKPHTCTIKNEKES